MAYKSRKRNIRSRREKLASAQRNTRLIILFTFLGFLVWVIMHRVSLWNWLKTYFY
ncbi:MAG: hypothetical protein KDC44_07385 [Phaeodactylibacter sp.]|nr:hypothetical protein [Phaeodactylibacter sp.]